MKYRVRMWLWSAWWFLFSEDRDFGASVGLTPNPPTRDGYKGESPYEFNERVEALFRPERPAESKVQL